MPTSMRPSRGGPEFGRRSWPVRMCRPMFGLQLRLEGVPKPVDGFVDLIETGAELRLALPDRVGDLSLIRGGGGVGAEEEYLVGVVGKDLAQLSDVPGCQPQDQVAVGDMRFANPVRPMFAEVEAAGERLLAHPRMCGAVDDAESAGGGDADPVAGAALLGDVTEQTLGVRTSTDVTAADETDVERVRSAPFSLVGIHCTISSLAETVIADSTSSP